jgi:predicted amidohydrolase
MKVRSSLESNLKAALASVKKAAKQKPKFIALPEYFSVPNNMEHFTSAEKISEETFDKTIKSFFQHLHCRRHRPGRR